MTRAAKTARFIVDRREGAVLVIESEQGKSRNVAASHLPAGCRAEGAVLDVPLDASDDPLWKKAVRNRAEEERLKRESASQLQRLRKTDPGGDVEL